MPLCILSFGLVFQDDASETLPDITPSTSTESETSFSNPVTSDSIDADTPVVKEASWVNSEKAPQKKRSFCLTKVQILLLVLFCLAAVLLFALVIAFVVDGKNSFRIVNVKKPLSVDKRG